MRGLGASIPATVRLLAAGLLCVALPAPATAQDAWSHLAQARAELERHAWTADFVQTFVPAGFSSGERESGKVSLQLPGQLRWDYEVPYPKCFLVQGGAAYTWNPGEPSGRKAWLEEDELSHLALLELDLDSLRARYRAELTGPADGVFEIVLEPLASDEEIRDARLVIDAANQRLVKVRYADIEGNTTEFELSGHRVAVGGALFAPPADLEWLDF